MKTAYICDAIRTPFGRYGGALATVRADDLAALPLRALMARHAEVDWTAVDDLLYGCANQAGEDNRNVARMAGLLAESVVRGRVAGVFAMNLDEATIGNYLLCSIQGLRILGKVYGEEELGSVVELILRGLS